MKIKFTLDKGAKAPTRAHDTDTGWDVYAKAEGIKIDYTQADVRFSIDTGLHVQPPDGYYFEIVPNSRISKTCFSYCNSIGVIDQSYRGSIKVVLRDNCGHNVEADEEAAKSSEWLSEVIEQKRPIGQLILRKRIDCEWVKVNKLSKTERGDGGFGSSEKKRPSSSGGTPNRAPVDEETGLPIFALCKYRALLFRRSALGVQFQFYFNMQHKKCREVAKYIKEYANENIYRIIGDDSMSRRDKVEALAELRSELETYRKTNLA